MGSRGELGTPVVLVIWFLRSSSVTGTGGWEERMKKLQIEGYIRVLYQHNGLEPHLSIVRRHKSGRKSATRDHFHEKWAI